MKEINYAQDIISRCHMHHTKKLEVVLPFITWFKRRILCQDVRKKLRRMRGRDVPSENQHKSSFYLGLKTALRYQLNQRDQRLLREEQNDALEKSRISKLDNDPFLFLGYGVTAYFIMIANLVLMLGFISLVFALPLMILYTAGEMDLSSLSKFSLGSLGGASTICE